MFSKLPNTIPKAINIEDPSYFFPMEMNWKDLLSQGILGIPASVFGSNNKEITILSSLSFTGWSKDDMGVGPIRGHRYSALIEEDMKSDTRKLDTTEAFYSGIDGGQGVEERSLRGFFERRRAFLLEHEEVGKAKKLSP